MPRSRRLEPKRRTRSVESTKVKIAKALRKFHYIAQEAQKGIDWIKAEDKKTARVKQPYIDAVNTAKKYGKQWGGDIQKMEDAFEENGFGRGDLIIQVMDERADVLDDIYYAGKTLIKLQSAVERHVLEGGTPLNLDRERSIWQNLQAQKGDIKARPETDDDLYYP